jgi:hypothetical protein
LTFLATHLLFFLQPKHCSRCYGQAIFIVDLKADRDFGEGQLRIRPAQKETTSGTRWC